MSEFIKRSCSTSSNTFPFPQIESQSIAPKILLFVCTKIEFLSDLIGLKNRDSLMRQAERALKANEREKELCMAELLSVFTN
jgi:hypothetical protein